jgi:uncharacterized protein (UPF0335 family)
MTEHTPEHILFETGESMNANENKPVAPEALRRIVANIESLQDAHKESARLVKEAFEEAKSAGVKMKPFRLFMRNRQRGREEVSEERRIAEAYQDIMEGGNIRI